MFKPVNWLSNNPAQENMQCPDQSLEELQCVNRQRQFSQTYGSLFSWMFLSTEVCSSWKETATLESPFLEPLIFFQPRNNLTETPLPSLQSTNERNFTMQFQTNFHFPWKFKTFGFHSTLIPHTCVSNLLYAITPLRSPPWIKQTWMKQTSSIVSFFLSLLCYSWGLFWQTRQLPSREQTN